MSRQSASTRSSSWLFGKALVAMWVVILSGLAVNAAQIPQFTTPVLVAELNSSGTDWGPWISPDGLEVYFASDRDDVPTILHIYHSTRSSPDTSFTAPVQVTEINQPPRQANPFVSGDGLTMYFCAYRPDPPSDASIWEITRPSITAPWDSGTQRLLPGVNTSDTVELNGGEQVTTDGLTMYFHHGAVGSSALDLCVSTRSSTLEDFGAPGFLSELNTMATEAFPFVTSDGLMIFFSSDRPGGRGGVDLYVAMRNSTSESFGQPVNLWNLNSEQDDWNPFFHERTGTLYLSSNRLSQTADIFRCRLVARPTSPTIAISPGSFQVSVRERTQAATQTLVVWNGGGGTLLYDIASTPSDVISVSPSSGQSSGEGTWHTVSFNTAYLSAGDYQGLITITGNGLNSPVVIPAMVTVLPGPPIPPGLRWSTFLGGSGAEQTSLVATDPEGNVCVTGWTASTDFPTSRPHSASYNGGSNDAIVSKFSPDGALLWSTYLGGNSNDQGAGIATDAAGNIYVSGMTDSPDFPTTGSFETAYNGGGDVFLAKFNADGALLWCSCLGGSGYEYGADVAVDPAGNIYLGGMTASSDFPTSGIHGTAYNGRNDVFLAKFNASGEMLWSALMGGSSEDRCYGIAVAGTSVYVTGRTESTDLPTSGGYDTTFNGGGGDGFLAKLDGADGNLLWCTYLGGAGEDRAIHAATYATDSVYLSGYTNSIDFPTSGGWDTSYNGVEYDVFVAKFNGSGALLWSTYLGGKGMDVSCGIAVDAEGNVHVTGGTWSPNFPAPVGNGVGYFGVGDAFVVRLSPSGSLTWSTCFGGHGTTGGAGVAADNAGNLYVTGLTYAADFPTSAGYDMTHNGWSDGFVLKIALSPTSTGTMIVALPQKFNVSVAEGAAAATQTLEVWNGDGGTLQYDIASTPSALIGVSPGSGQSSGQLAVYTVSFNTTQLSPGVHIGHITITGNGSNSPVVIPVQIAVIAGPELNLEWSTYLGGNAADGIGMVRPAPNGNIYVTVNVDSGDFPFPAEFPPMTTRTNTDVAVTLFDTFGLPLRNTFLAGNAADVAMGLAIDPQGNLVMTGYTWSTDLATTGAYDTHYNGGGTLWGDAFIAKMRPDATLLWCTYLGGTGQDYGWHVITDANGNIVLTGMTDSTDFPTSGPYSRGPAFERDSFVAKFSPDGRLLWSTYLGGNGEDLGYGVAVDSAGNVYVGGRTTSTDFPTTGPWSSSFHGGSYDGYMAKFSPDGMLLWSTYIGGTGADTLVDVICDNVNIYVTGGTDSTDFPTSGGWDTTINAGSDIFLVKLGLDGSLRQATFLGGSGNDEGSALAFGREGNIYVTAVSGSDDFPTAGGGTTDYRGGDADVTLSGFNSSGILIYSTIWGGSNVDMPRSLATDTSGSVYVVGQTSSDNFPTPYGWDKTYNWGAWDGFITKFVPVIPPTRPLIATSAIAFEVYLSEGAQPTTPSLYVWNHSYQMLQYNIETSPTNLIAGAYPPSGQAIWLQKNWHYFPLNTQGLPAGVYTGRITITGNAANSPVVIPMRITIAANPPQLSVTPPFVGLTILQGQSTTRPIEVRNIGGATAIYTIATTPTWISVQPTSGSAAAGESVAHIVSLATRDLLAGRYFGHLTITGNFPSFVDVPVEVVVETPLGAVNLVVSNVDVAPVMPWQLRPGDPISLCALIHSNGLESCGPFWTEVWGSRTGGLTLDRFLADSVWLPGLGAFNNAHAWVTTAPLYSIPDGPYTVVYAADRLGEVAETNERDNRAVVRGRRILVIRPQTQTDLAVEGFGMSPNPALAGQTVAFTGRVINRGAEPSGPFWIEFWGSFDWPYPNLDFFLCDSIWMTNLDPGASVDLATYPRQLYNVPTGVFMIGCVADRDDSINELDETNNYQFVDGQVFNSVTLISRNRETQLLLGADVAVLSADITPVAPTQSAPGDTITLTVELANQGTGNTGPFWLEYWGSRDGGLTLCNFLTVSDHIANLAPGARVRLSSAKPLWGIPDGPYSVVVFADRPENVSETNESNNRRVIAGKRLLVIRPRLWFNLVDMAVSQFNVSVGSWPQAVINGEVRNESPDDSGPFWIEFWACPGDPDYPWFDRYLCDSIQVDNLAPHGVIDFSDYPRRIYDSLPPGEYAVICFMDRLGQLTDVDYTDNYQIVRNVSIPAH